ncbi:MAG TPA: polysaccharide biosynthesis/export family protein [Nitrospirales bacterium]|nr:polysaccharide biosynthesis/export family protein [Nitrospirales bacterium]
MNITNIQLAYRWFYRHSLIRPNTVPVLLALVLCGGISVHQTPAYADPGSVVIGKASNPEDIEKIENEVFSIMKQQLRSYQQSLEESEGRLQDFQRKHGIILIETQMNHLLQQRLSLDDSLKQAENQVKGFQERLAWVQGQISQIPEQIPLSSSASEQGVVGGAKNNLLTLQLKEQELLNKYTENNPHIQSIRKEMELINQFIKEQESQVARSVSTGKNPLYLEMEMQLFHTQADLVSAEAQSEVIKQQIAGVDKELDRLRNLGPELDELRRQVTADEKNYINYLTKVGKTPPQDYQIQVGDQLDIKFFFNPELNETVLVRPDGRIALQLVGEITVVGHTVEQIRAILIKTYSGQLKNPEVAVLLRSTNVPGEDSGTTAAEGNFGGK